MAERPAPGRQPAAVDALILQVFDLGIAHMPRVIRLDPAVLAHIRLHRAERPAKMANASGGRAASLAHVSFASRLRHSYLPIKHLPAEPPPNRLRSSPHHIPNSQSRSVSPALGSFLTHSKRLWFKKPLRSRRRVREPDSLCSQRGHSIAMLSHVAAFALTLAPVGGYTLVGLRAGDGRWSASPRASGRAVGRANAIGVRG